MAGFILGPLVMNRKPEITMDSIGGERRKDRRYTLDLELRYTVTRGKHVLQQGTGRTTDISSGGVAFSTTRPLPLRNTAELSVEWPATLNGCRLRLVIQGKVVRNDNYGAAVRILKHEFRVAGAARPEGVERGAGAPFFGGRGSTSALPLV